MTDRDEHASKAKSVHQRACNEAMADLIRIRPTCTPASAIAAMMTTTKPIRTARKVRGSIYGRPRRAPINPVLHKSTNSAGAVAIASRVSMGIRQGEDN